MSCRVLVVRKWIPCDLPHKSHRRASIERQHGIQQNLCAGRCIGLSNRFSLVMAETACARNKDHGSRYDLREATVYDLSTGRHKSTGVGASSRSRPFVFRSDQNAAGIGWLSQLMAGTRRVDPALKAYSGQRAGSSQSHAAF
jgi:hypothetical protein